jgi:ABC-2 type transport system ATP-binding protein
MGEAYVAGGALDVAGMNAARRAHLPVVGVAPLDPPLPRGFKSIDYVLWSARLAGVDRRAAKELAGRALALLGLVKAQARALSSLALPERRVLVLAQAIVTSPEVIIAEAPLAGLDGSASDFVRRALEAAAAGRRLIASVTGTRPGSSEGDLAMSASYTAVMREGQLVLEGAPGDILLPSRTYAVTVPTNAEGFRVALMERGIEVRGGPTHFGIVLPHSASPVDILRAAWAVHAPVVELVPVIG